MDDYQKLLDRALEKLPAKKAGGERFEMPRLDVFIQGNQTIIKNFADICSKLSRDQKHVLKFLSRALAAPANAVNGRAIFQSKIQIKFILAKLNTYVKEYVICPVCKRPDTALIRQGKITLLKCQACGARNSLK